MSVDKIPNECWEEYERTHPLVKAELDAVEAEAGRRWPTPAILRAFFDWCEQNGKVTSDVLTLSRDRLNTLEEQGKKMSEAKGGAGVFIGYEDDKKYVLWVYWQGASAALPPMSRNQADLLIEQWMAVKQGEQEPPLLFVNDKTCVDMTECVHISVIDHDEIKKTEERNREHEALHHMMAMKMDDLFAVFKKRMDDESRGEEWWGEQE